MGTAYPGALDDTSGDIPLTGANPDVFLGSTVDSGVDFTHPTHHEMLAGAAEALEAKVGIGASTPVLGKQLRATATGTSKWEGFTEVVYRAAGDGSDDAAGIRAILAAATGPLRILLPDDDYEFRTVDANSCAVAINAPNIWFVGKGRDKVSSGADGGEGDTTAIRAMGAAAAGMTMFRWYADEGSNTSDNTDEVYGGGIENLSISGNSVATYGLELRAGVNGLTFRNLHIAHFTTDSVIGGTGCTHSGTNHTWHSTFDITFDKCHIRAFGSSNCVRLTGNPNVAGGENSYGWHFTGCFLQSVNGYAYYAEDCDDIYVIGGTAGHTGTGSALYLSEPSGTKSGGGGRAFIVLGAFGSWNNATAKAGSGTLNSTRGNLLLGISHEDREGVPTMEAGANLYMLTNNGRHNLVPDLRIHALLTEDFLGGGTANGTIGQNGWHLSNGSVAVVASEADHAGILRLSTGSSINTVASMSPSSSTTAGMLLPAETFDLQWIFRLTQVDADTVLRIGLGMPYSTDGLTNGIWLEMLGSSATTWIIRQRVAGSLTSTGIGTAVNAAEWYRLRIKRRNPDRIGLSFGETTNESDDYTFTTCPTLTLDPFVQLKTLAAADKSVDLDSCQLFINGLSR